MRDDYTDALRYAFGPKSNPKLEKLRDYVRFKSCYDFLYDIKPFQIWKFRENKSRGGI